MAADQGDGGSIEDGTFARQGSSLAVNLGTSRQSKVKGVEKSPCGTPCISDARLHFLNFLLSIPHRLSVGDCVQYPVLGGSPIFWEIVFRFFGVFFSS